MNAYSSPTVILAQDLEVKGLQTSILNPEFKLPQEAPDRHSQCGCAAFQGRSTTCSASAPLKTFKSLN